MDVSALGYEAPSVRGVPLTQHVREKGLGIEQVPWTVGSEQGPSIRGSGPTEKPSENVRLDDVSPIRTYDLWRSHGVRDRVSGHSEGDVRKVLAGRLDPFLEAHADKRARPVRVSAPEVES